MKTTCNFYTPRFENKCSVLKGIVNCQKCSFYLTELEYNEKLQKLNKNYAFAKGYGGGSLE